MKRFTKNLYLFVNENLAIIFETVLKQFETIDAKVIPKLEKLGNFKLGNQVLVLLYTPSKQNMPSLAAIKLVFQKEFYST